MANEQAIKSDLERFLKVHFTRRKFFFHKRLSAIETVINEILVGLESCDIRLRFQPMNPKGYYNVKSANEIEVMLVLTDLCINEVILEETTGKPEQVMVRVLPGYEQARWSDLCGVTPLGKTFLSAKKFHANVHKVVKKVVERIPNVFRWMEGVTCEVRDDEDKLEIEIQLEDDMCLVTLLPALDCQGIWPFVAQKWRTRSGHHPPLNIRQNLPLKGVHVVAKPQSEKCEYFWTISFAKIEKKLVDNFPLGCKGTCLKMLRMIRERDLRESGILTNYHLQTILLHALERDASTLWHEDQFFDRLQSLLRTLKECLEQKSCPHYFIPEINLFADCKEPENFEVLAVKVGFILRDLRQYLKMLISE